MPVLRSQEEVAQEIRRLREAAGLSLAALAERAGKPGQASQFSKYERGATPPSLETLHAIAQAAGVPVDVFYRDAASDALSAVTPAELVELRRMLEGVVRQAGDALAIVARALGEVKDPTAGEAMGPKDEDAPAGLLRLSTEPETAAADRKLVKAKQAAARQEGDGPGKARA